MSRTNEIQQLYIGLLGRAADAEGLAYWDGTGLSIAEIAQWIVEDAPEFPRGERGEAVDALYANLFNREPDAEGRNYWVNESEVSIDELVLHLIEWADPTDSTTLANRTFVANAYTTANAERELDLEAAAAVIADVNHTTQSVTDALNTIEGGANADPTQALATYQQALEDERAYLEGVAEALELNVDATTPNMVIETALDVALNGDATATPAIPGAVDAVVSQLENLEAALTGPAATKIGAYADAFAGASATVRAEIIAEAKAESAKVVTGAQREVNETTGLLSKVNALVSAKNSLASAAQKEAGAELVLNAEAAKVEGLNSAITAVPTATYTKADPTATPAVEVNYVINAPGAGDIIELKNGRLAITEAGKAVQGIDALLAAAVNDYQAKLALESATGSFETRLADVINTETTPTTPVVVDSSDYTINPGEQYTVSLEASGQAAAATDSLALIEARDADAALDKAVSDFQGLSQLKVGQEQAKKAVEDAQDAIEALGYELVTDGTGTSDDDLFVFTGADLSIVNFGLDGNDLLFVGDAFAEVRVAAGEDAVTDRLGDASVLELFFQQEGNTAVIYVEKQAFAGNATNGDDLATIELVGVNIADLAYENGYISVA